MTRTVEMVIPLFASGLEDPVEHLELDDEIPLPPQNTQIIGMSGWNYNPVIARDKDTGDTYQLRYDSGRNESYWGKI